MRAIFILHRKGVILRDTCDYPTTSNAYFTMVLEPKLSDYMKGEDFRPPPEPLLDGRNIGNSVLLWYWVKSIYDRGKIFFQFFLHFGYKKYTNKSLYR